MDSIVRLCQLLPQVSQVWQSVRAAATWSSSTSSSSSLELENEISSILDDLESVKRTSALIKATLVDAEERAVRGEQCVCQWFLDLHHLAHRVSDLVGLYEYEVIAQEVRNQDREAQKASNSVAARKRKAKELYQVHDSCPLINSSFRQEFSCAIRKFREEYEEINKLKEALSFDKEDVETINPRAEDTIEHLSTGSIPDDIFFGREKNMQELIELLLRDDLEQCDTGSKSVVPVIALVGMGGVGKTTLVQHAFNNPDVFKHFALSGWVYVSDDFHVERLTRATIEALEVDQCLTDAVREKKFLLVLDDVWNENVQQWDALYRSLKDGAKGSKIIITTRNKIVACTTRPLRCIDVDCLENEDAWTLFKMFAFKNHTSCELEHPRLVAIGKQIAQKCNGLPLAIKVLGRYLRHEYEDEDIWNRALQSDLWDLEMWGEGKQVFGPLTLSYLHLPANLKPCFVISSVFPKDTKILRRDLIELWMAHDLVDDHNEDQGMRYIESLLSRSFCFDDRSHDFKKTNYVMMHDFIHDLAQYLSRDKIFYIKYTSDTVCAKASIPDSVHHAYIEDTDATFVQFCHDHNCSSSLRTLANNQKRKFPLSIQSPGLIKLDGLRKLTFHQPKLQINNGFLLDCLGHVRNLRQLDFYLRPYGISETELDAICTLYNLCILDLHRDMASKPLHIKLPDSIGNLRHLTRLHIPMAMNVPESICCLTKLHTMNLEHAWISYLPDRISQLVNLKTLILDSSKIRSLPESIGSLNALQVLSLNYCKKLERLPRSLVNLTNMTDLNVTGSDTWAEGFCVPAGFGNLTKLRELPIFRVPPKGSIIKHAGIEELRDLVNIHDSLSIVGLNNVVRHEDAAQARLMNKAYIENLELHWTEVKTSFNYSYHDIETSEEMANDEEDEDFTDGDSEGFSIAANIGDRSNDALSKKTNMDEKEYTLLTSVQDEQVLENLRPHTNIQDLGISRWRGRKLASWLGDESFVNLTHVFMKNIPHCTSLCPLDQLPSLIYLQLCAMPSLTCLALPSSSSSLHSNSEKNTAEPDTSRRSCFPMLRSLIIGRDCSRLVSLADVPLASLETLELTGCGSLTGMPPLPVIEEATMLDFSGSFDILFDSFSSLKKLVVYRCVSSTCIPLQKLPALTSLTFDDCRNSRFSDHINLPSSLKFIEIIGCPWLREWCDTHRQTKLAHLPKVEECGEGSVKYFRE